MTTGKHQAYPIEDKDDLKTWVLIYPDADRLMREIVFRWRGSNVRAAGAAGKWAAYPRSDWQAWMGFKNLSKLKRTMERLRLDGMIRSEPHKFGGTQVLTFIQPTQLALKYYGRPADLRRLSPVIIPENEPSSEPSSGPPGEPSSEPSGGPSDYTSLPSLLLSDSPTFQKEPSGFENPKGKGKAGEGMGTGKAMKVKDPEVDHIQPNAPVDDDAEVDAKMAAMMEAKVKTALAKYPPQQGPHEKAVKHPSILHGVEAWVAWSETKKAEKQALYETYVANWYAGQGGKGKQAHLSWADWTDDDDAAFVAAVENKASKG